jgi:hypothetical protein
LARIIGRDAEPNVKSAAPACRAIALRAVRQQHKRLDLAPAVVETMDGIGKACAAIAGFERHRATLWKVRC